SRLHQSQAKNLITNQKLQKTKIDRFVAVVAKHKNVSGAGSGFRILHGCLQPLSPAQQPPDTRNQDGEFKGLCQIVISAGFETAQHVVWWTRGGQHKSRNELPALSKLRHHEETILPREHDIQNQS